jgi:hypothetical protein
VELREKPTGLCKPRDGVSELVTTENANSVMGQAVSGGTVDGGSELGLGNHVAFGHLKLPSLKDDRRKVLN